MKTMSVLTKRAVIYAAIVASTAVVVMLVTALILTLAAGMGALAALLIAFFAGALCAGGVGYLMLDSYAGRASRAIVKLRDVAVSITKGKLDARADGRAPGELGQLGKALNDLSYQLSSNMYQLILERNRLKQTMDNLSEGVLALDLSGSVTHRNPATEDLLLGGAHMSDSRLRHVADSAVWNDFKRVIETGESTERNIVISGRTIRCVARPIIDETGATAGAVGLFSDITQMELLERTRRDYVANVSHEMRTPLTAMRALIEPLKEGMVRDEAARMRYYDIILREIMRLSRLITDLMELSRLQSGALAVEKQSMKLDELLFDVCERYSAIAREHALAFDIVGDFEKLPQVLTNPDRVEQMMVILLDNAIKYTEKGGLTVSASYDAKKVTITVADTGIGIAEEDLPYVFDRFYKVDKAHSGKGSGLGLSIAKELWKWMGEELRAESEKGKGTRFSFTVARDL